MPRREFGDLSFMMQKLDNTGTVVEVDRAVAEFWRAHEQIVDVEEFLTRRIVDLRLREKEIQFGQASDQITIHRGEATFVAQFHVDVRDEANRPATVLCYGRLPRALQHGTDHHGERLLRNFLERREIPWTNRIGNRYAAVCRELSKQPGPLTSFLGKLLQPPPRPAPAVRLEPQPRRDEAPSPVDEAPPPVREAPPPVREAPPPVREAPSPVDEAPSPVDEAPPPVDEAPPPVTEVIPEKQILPDTGSLIDASPLLEADPRPEAAAALPETEELPAHPLHDEPASDLWPSESATGGTEDA